MPLRLTWRTWRAIDILLNCWAAPTTRGYMNMLYNEAGYAVNRNLIRKMLKAGMLTQKRGKWKGYDLNRDLKSLTIYEVMTTVETPDKFYKLSDYSAELMKYMMLRVGRMTLDRLV